ncbi:thiol S-methyltransferase TMT1B-like [Babylonia areolata]|uniref:thiol S-methyltransferase TMT1B-like n=1 Tax=Babylonia areolata TaxID=304850 RepID=UPI003FD527E1
MANGFWTFGSALLSIPLSLYLYSKLFPKRSKLMKKKFSAWVCSKVMWMVHAKCAQQKITLFEKFDILDCNGAPPHILEVGVGTGSNLEFFPKQCTLSCLDPNQEHCGYVTQALQQHPGIKMDKFVQGYAEDMKEFEDNTFDAVVCTFTLCSVRQLEKSLSEIRRVLKPGRSFFFLEHVAAPRNTPARCVQDWMQVVWTTLAEGCHLNRETGTTVQEAGFSTVQVKHFTADVTKLFAFIKFGVYGVAVK